MSSFITEDQVKTNMTYLQMLKALWPYARRHPFILSSSLFSVVAVAASSRLMPALVGYAIDHGIQVQNKEVLYWCAIGFLIAEIGHSFFLFLYQYLFQSFGNRMLFYIREDLLNHVQHLPMTYFNKTPTGRIVTRLTNDTSTLGEVFTDGIINVFTESLVLVSIFVSMALISIKLTVATLVLTPLFIALSYRITEKIRSILRDSKKSLSVMNSFTTENLNGIKVIQLFNRVEKNRKRFATLSMNYRNVLMESIRHYAYLQPIMNLFNAVTITVALYYGGLLSTENSLALGALVAFLMHVQDCIHPLREILDKYQQFQNSLTSAERVFQLLDEKKESDPKSPMTTTEKLKGLIEFKNLSFRYESQLPLVLKNLNFSISSGQSLALVGRTGSGKSTLISLLQRFYEPPVDSLFVDGIAIENLPRNFLRSRIGVVQQDNFIFRGSLKDNVGLLNPDISNDIILKSLEQVGYLKLLERSGRSIDFQIEEKGANLSVGERQLIAFARILAFSPDILILDEATSNIDSETEKLIQKATYEVTKNRTSIIVAHRLSTVRDCDQILVLDQGQISELGTHEELLKKGGLYAHVAEAGSDLTSILS